MTESDSSPPWSRDLLLLALALGLLLGFRLGSYPLANPDEGRYAEIPREMVVRGDWVTPRLDGVNYFEKPPLMYWAVAACLELLGPSEWAVRAAPALFALAGVLLTYAAARRIHGRDAGLAAALVLGTSLLYFGLGRFLVLDMAVSVLMSATLFCFILGVREPPGRRRRWLFYGLYASAALATLTKGLIGFLLPGAVMFLWLLLFDQWRRLRPFYLPTGALFFLAIAAPWHVLAALRNPDLGPLLPRLRALGALHRRRRHGRPGPWWYFCPIVLLGLFPWTGFLWAALPRRAAPAAGRGGGRTPTPGSSSIWAAFIFLFFSALPLEAAPLHPAGVSAAGRAHRRVAGAGLPAAGRAAIALGPAQLRLCLRASGRGAAAWRCSRSDCHP